MNPVPPRTSRFSEEPDRCAPNRAAACASAGVTRPSDAPPNPAVDETYARRPPDEIADHDRPPLLDLRPREERAAGVMCQPVLEALDLWRPGGRLRRHRHRVECLGSPMHLEDVPRIAG